MYLGRGEEIFGGKKAEYEKAVKETQKETAKLGGIGGLFDVSVQQGLMSIFRELKIDFTYLHDTWDSLSADQIIQIYEKTNDIVNLMKAKPDMFSDEERIRVENILNNLSGAYTKLNSITQEQVNYLQKWSESQDFYKDIPTQLLIEFQTALKAINDPLSTYNENMANANKLGKAFASATQNDKDIFSRLFDTNRTKDSAQKYHDKVINEVTNLSDDIKNLSNIFLRV